jgi:hypothetical protein
MRVMDNDELVSVLDSYDEALLRYVDADQELSLEAVTYVCDVATKVMAGSISWSEVEASDWYALASALVIVYGTEGLDDLRLDASLGEDSPEVTGSDRRFLTGLRGLVSRYETARSLGQSPRRG